MTDVFTTEERSRIMKAVKSRGNKSTELKLIEVFKKNRIKGWRRNYPLFGNPDFAFPGKRIAVFADGCFWHGHDCRQTEPDENADYWKKKIDRNRKRDEIVSDYLNRKNWRVFRVWQCAIKTGTLPSELLSIARREG